MPKIRIEKELKAERQQVFDMMANYENLEKTLPEYFPSVRVRSVRDNVAVVEEHLRLGQKELIMTIKHITKYPESHEFFVLGGDAKGSHIIERYEKIQNGTKLSVFADIKLSGREKILDLFTKSSLTSEFGKMIDRFCMVIDAD